MGEDLWVGFSPNDSPQLRKFGFLPVCAIVRVHLRRCRLIGEVR